MKSIKQIKKIAKGLSAVIIENKTINIDKIFEILKHIKSNNLLKKIGIEESEKKTFLKELFYNIKNLLIENSVNLTIPINLSEEELSNYRKDLEKKYQGKIVNFTVDSDIIAGTKIRNAWNITDSTIRNKLNILNK